MSDDSPSSTLAKYGQKVFDSFAAARKKSLEPRWNESRDNFNSVFKSLWKHEEGKDWRSKVTPGTVRQKVMTAYSMMVDIALQGGKIPLAFKPSPRMLEQDVEAALSNQEELDAAKDVIDEQYAKCHADRAYGNNIMYGAMYGITYAKRVREVYETTGFESVEFEGMEEFGITDMGGVPSELLEFEERIFSEEGPGWYAGSNWEIFADPEANYNPRQGQGWFHVRDVSPYFLRTKLGRDYFLDKAIESVLEEGRRRKGEKTGDGDESSLPPYLRDLTDRKKTITYRESFLRIPRKVAEQFERELRVMNGRTRDGLGKYLPWEAPSAAEHEYTGDDIWVHFVLADRHIIRYVRVDAQDNPMYSAKWEDVVDEPGGRGVADNTKQAHEGIAKVMRAIEDNTNWSENVTGFIKPNMIEGRIKSLYPGQTVVASESAKSASDAFAQIKIENKIDGLLVLLATWEKYADWDSMMAKISQGQIEKSDATATEIMTQESKGDKYSGSVIRNYDEGLVEPISTDIFHENMRDPNVTRGRGDFVIQALGFQAFQDRVVRVRMYRTLLELALSNENVFAEFKLRGILDPMVNAMQVDPDSVLKTTAEKQQEAMAIQEQQAREREALENAPPDPTIAAKVRKEDAAGQAALMNAETKQAEVELKAEEQEQRRIAEQLGAPQQPVV